MSISSPLRWGILGCARISRGGLIPGIQSSKSSRLVALASRDAGTAARWREEFAIPKSYGSYEEILTDPEIDAVYIPLPNELHKPWVLAAADAGKHVLCEKPLALNAAEAREMADACRRAGVLLMEGFMWRHQPRTAAVRELIASGRIGELRLVRSSFSFPIDLADWRLDPSRGGGALWDIGCYGVNTARLFAGAEPLSVRSRAHFSPAGTDVALTAELEFPGGVLGLIDCSFEQPFRCTYEIVGRLGRIEVPLAYLPPSDAPKAIVTSDGSTTELTFDPTNQYAMMVDGFAKSVQQGRLADPAEDGVNQMTALDAILLEARGCGPKQTK